MTGLVVRDLDFRFDDDIALHWNPGNPHWSNLVNFITLIAPAFERYAIRATRDALPRIRNPAVRADAELFTSKEKFDGKKTSECAGECAQSRVRYQPTELVKRDRGCR